MLRTGVNLDADVAAPGDSQLLVMIAMTLSSGEGANALTSWGSHVQQSAAFRAQEAVLVRSNRKVARFSGD